MTRLFCLALAALLLAAPAAFAQNAGASAGLTESVLVVPLSRGTELRALVSKRNGATAPDTAILLFPGYPGVLKLKEENGAISFEIAGNFLMRARRFLNTDQTFTVAVDCPVDKWSSCDDDYRTSGKYVADISELVARVKSSLGAKKVYLVGTSYGTESSSYLARALTGSIDGAVHTATFTDPKNNARAHGSPMRVFDWSKAEVPQLFVHHKDDPCEVTRYSSVVERKGKIPLITVEGSGQPRGDACEAFTAHGFVGREKLTMEAILGWITERKQPETIGAN